MAVISDEKRYARSQKFRIPDQMWSIQAKEQGLRPVDIFCKDQDRADPEPMVRRMAERTLLSGQSCRVFSFIITCMHAKR